MSNEHPDPEQALLKALANVSEFKKEFKKEVHSLKTQLGKLKRQVESLELMDFQDQLDRLNEYIKKTSDELTKTIKNQTEDLQFVARIVSILRIDSLSDNYLQIMEHQLPNKQHLAAQLYSDATGSKTKISTSDNPYEVAVEFKKKWDKTLEDLGAETIKF